MFASTEDPTKVLIYIDPPYKGNSYGQDSVFFRDFETDKMWALARRLQDQGNRVFVSEYTGPSESDDFVTLKTYG